MTAAADILAPLPHAATGSMPAAVGRSRVWQCGRGPGGVAYASGAGELALVDAGMDAEHAEEALTEAWRESGGARLSAVVWTGPDAGLGARVPEHAVRVHPDQVPPGGAGLPGLPAVVHRIGDHTSVVWDPGAELLIAGDLLAPGVPLLAHITVRQARAALHWALGLDPLTAVGSHGAVAHGSDIGRALRTRLVYLDTLESIARAGITYCTTPRAAAAAAWDRGTLSTWANAAPHRHLINVHAAYAHVMSRALDVDAAYADAHGLGRH